MASVDDVNEPASASSSEGASTEPQPPEPQGAAAKIIVSTHCI